MLVTGNDQMKQEQVILEMEQFEDDLRRLLEVNLGRLAKQHLPLVR